MVGVDAWAVGWLVVIRQDSGAKSVGVEDVRGYDDVQCECRADLRLTWKNGEDSRMIVVYRQTNACAKAEECQVVKAGRCVDEPFVW